MSSDLQKTHEKVSELLGGMLRELRCTICLDTLREATSTPCNHLYCRVCIEIAAKNEDFKCPLCNRAIPTDHLRPAFDIQEIVKEFVIMRDDFEQQNEMNLSQVPVTRFLSHGDSLEEESSPRIPVRDEEIPVSNVRSAAVESRQLRIYLESGEKPDIDIPNVTFVDKVNEDTTHIVMDFDDVEHKLVKCNEIYLSGILYGCYIVESKWLNLCIEANKIIPEDRFEATGDIGFGRTGAPKKSRANRNDGKPQRLFKGLRARFINDDKVTRRYQKYIRIGGGTIVDYGEIIVCSEDMDSVDVDEIQAKYEDKKLLFKDWIDECICKYELEKKDKHYL